MFEVRIVNGEGERICGPFESMAEAQTEKERWQATGGCTVNEIRPIALTSPVAAPAVVDDDDNTPVPTKNGKRK